jgi:4-amino-4-deoxy-L-arabinose transferase-like glycosyltransferase
VRSHWLFGLLLVAGAVLRIVTSLAYHPALLRVDSVGYLRNSQSLAPFDFHPIGYPALLRLLPVHESLAAVTALQHVLVLVAAVLVYILLRRLSVPTWLAALATAPVLLDAYQLNIEQFVLSESLFQLLLVAGCAALLWRQPPGFLAVGLAGLVLAAAALTRTVALVLVLPAALGVLFASAPLPVRARLARAAVLVAAFAIPVAGYAAWFQSHHGEFALTSYGGRILYGRIVEIGGCEGLSVPAHERPLCVTAGPGERPTANQLLWYREHSPFLRLDPPPGKTDNEVGGDFARRVIRARPLSYLRLVGADLLQGFAPTKTTGYDDLPLERWTFPERYSVPRDGHRWSDAQGSGLPEDYAVREADSRFASALRSYQRFGYVPGTVLGLCLLVALAAALGLGRSKRSGLRAPAFVFAALGFTLLVAVAATTFFNWRYQLPQLVLLPPAAALGLTALLGLRNERSPA